MSAGATVPIPTRVENDRNPEVYRLTSPGVDRLRVAVLATERKPSGHGPCEQVARQLAACPLVGEVISRFLPVADGPTRDPYRLRDRIPDTGADAAVVVAPRRWGPRRLVPSPTIDGRPVAIVQEDAPIISNDRMPQPDPAVPWVVAAMAKDVFLRSTEHWVATLNQGGRPTVDLRADRARRSDLIAALRSGPSVVLYAGHGRTRGWSGYQALRQHHLESGSGSDPGTSVGIVIAFACDTLKRARSRVPFGCQIVDAGLARSYLGAVGSIRTSDAEELSEIVIDQLSTSLPPTVAHLMASVDRALAERPGGRRAWLRFRLVGDFTAPLRPHPVASPLRTGPAHLGSRRPQEGTGPHVSGQGARYSRTAGP